MHTVRVNIAPVLVYLAALLLAAFPVAWLRHLRQRHADPFLGRFQAYTLTAGLVSLAILIIAVLGPVLNVVEPRHGLRLEMLAALIVVPALIINSYLFLHFAFSLVLRRIPAWLNPTFFGFWGLFYMAFVVAEIRFFQSGNTALINLFRPLFDAGMAAFSVLGLAALVVPPKTLPVWQGTLAKTVAGVMAARWIFIGVSQWTGMVWSPPTIMVAHLTLLACNGGIAFWMGHVLRLRVATITPDGPSEPELSLFLRHRITKREQEVVRAVLAGCSNAEIADRLFISEKTVETHLYNTYQKLGVRNRVQLLNLFRTK